MKVEPLTPDPERLGTLGRVFAAAPGGEREALFIEAFRMTGAGPLLKFAGYDTPEAAAALKGRILEVPRAEARQPPPGEVLYADVIGMRAVHADTGEEIGRIAAVITAGNDLLEIATPEGEVFVPWVPEFVGQADLAAGTLPIRPIPGLLEP